MSLQTMKRFSHSVKDTLWRSGKYMDAVAQYSQENSWKNIMQVAWTWHAMGDTPINMKDDDRHTNDLISQGMLEHVSSLAVADLLEMPSSFVTYLGKKDPSIIAKLTGERANKLALFVQGPLVVVFKGPDWFYSHCNLTEAVEFVMAHWTEEFDLDDADAGDDPTELDRDQLRNAIVEKFKVDGIEGVREMLYGGMW